MILAEANLPPPLLHFGYLYLSILFTFDCRPASEIQDKLQQKYQSKPKALSGMLNADFSKTKMKQKCKCINTQNMIETLLRKLQEKLRFDLKKAGSQKLGRRKDSKIVSRNRINGGSSGQMAAIQGLMLSFSLECSQKLG